MKKKKKNGFVMIETILVGVFIVSVFTFLYANVKNILGQYEGQILYNDVDAIYRTNEVRNVLLNGLITHPNGAVRVINNSLRTNANGYIKFSGSSICGVIRESPRDTANLCYNLLSDQFLDVVQVVVTNYNTGPLKAKIKKAGSNGKYLDSRALEDYIMRAPTYERIKVPYRTYRRVFVLYGDGKVGEGELTIRG